MAGTTIKNTPARKERRPAPCTTHGGNPGRHRRNAQSSHDRLENQWMNLVLIYFVSSGVF